MAKGNIDKRLSIPQFMHRVLILDLLIERKAFGHYGNLEILRPFSEKGDVECWLLTPQMQNNLNLQSSNHAESSTSAKTTVDIAESAFHSMTSEDFHPFTTPGSNLSSVIDVEDVCFREEVEMNGNRVILQRMQMPQPSEMKNWLQSANANALVCAGSRYNVSMWEGWMDVVAELLRKAVELRVPTLGICFGHQILAKSLGGDVNRALECTDLVSEVNLTEIGFSDPLFAELSIPRGLFTHQDHVSNLPPNCILLATIEHSNNCAFRVVDFDGIMLPVWGLQFHPEAQDSVISHAIIMSEFSQGQQEIFSAPHDGGKVLSNFANIAMGHQ
jgi:GMP synthase (glutamine-hydrolysing)